MPKKKDMSRAANAIRPSKGGLMKIVIDRIEKDLAVCETQNRKMIHIPVSHFTSIPKPGEIYEKTENSLTFLSEETAEKKRAIENRFAKLVKGGKSF